MVVTFASLSWLSWKGKRKLTRVADCSSSNNTKHQFKSKANGNNIASSSKRIRRKWNSREERKLDKENDAVLVPHDGGCISGSESEDSDWSVGWLEPHGPQFMTDDNDESNNSFAVLVPCYGRGVHNVTIIPQNKIFDLTGNFSDNLPAESMKYMEKWLSSLQNN